jgi:G3E family GTPase
LIFCPGKERTLKQPFNRQIALADRIIVNKTDLVTQEGLADLLGTIQ